MFRLNENSSKLLLTATVFKKWHRSILLSKVRRLKTVFVFESPVRIGLALGILILSVGGQTEDEADDHGDDKIDHRGHPVQIKASKSNLSKYLTM